jgi:hypothetical protein
MPSGFLILPDGRCFAKRWSAYDAVLHAVADHLALDQATVELHDWLVKQLPGPDDIEEVGYRPWFRVSDRQLIARHLDLRLLAPKHQQAFCEAAKNAVAPPNAPDWLKMCLDDFADMVVRCERGEPPLSKSDWREVLPPEGDPIGPE